MSRSLSLNANRLTVACTLLLATGMTAGAAELSHEQMNDKESAKNSNVAVAKQINGDTDDLKKSKKDKSKENAKEGKNDKLGGESGLSDEKNKADAKKTADVVNQVPGVKVTQNDMTPPEAPPIKGFHPIKRLLRPVENLEGMSVKLEQQIMKLEGPIAGLQPPMINLQKKMVTVDDHISSMQGQLTGMQNEVTGVRSDIAAMRKDIEALKQPIVALRGPIGTVAKPLEKLQTQLNFIILAIIIATFGIALGTPLAAILIYRNRKKLFPEMKDKANDLPKVEAPPAQPTSGRR